MGKLCRAIGKIKLQLPVYPMRKVQRCNSNISAKKSFTFPKLSFNLYNLVQTRAFSSSSDADAGMDEQKASKESCKMKDSSTNKSSSDSEDEDSSNLPKPTWPQLRLLIISSAIPFLGFGFIDNLIMIIMGDMIDTSMCVILGFSTMAAAAWGNLFSDVLGVFSGGWIELAALRMGFKPPRLLPHQLKLPITRLMNHIGSSIGVSIGCILGMCPLLFIDTKEAERLKHEAETHDLFKAILEELADILDAEKAALFLIDPASNEMYTKATDSFIDIRRPVGLGISGRVCATAQLMNVKDAYVSPYFAGEFPSKNGEDFRTKAVLCAPIFGQKGVPIGVVEVLNTKTPGGCFNQRDEYVIQAIASHIAVHIEGKGGNFKSILWLCRDHVLPRDRGKERKDRGDWIDRVEEGDGGDGASRHNGQRRQATFSPTVPPNPAL
eukprot:Platyproteum_vivax@DN1924_c0_g1_i1.p1